LAVFEQGISLRKDAGILFPAGRLPVEQAGCSEKEHCAQQKKEGAMRHV